MMSGSVPGYAGCAVGPTLSLVTSRSIMIRSSGVICGVTVRLSTASLNWVVVAPLTVPAYIEVIVSDVVVKKQGQIYGNIAAAVVVDVDEDPAYGPDPGKEGWGVIVAVIEDTDVFPPPAEISATQTQPESVLPGEQINITVDVSNPTANVALSMAQKLNSVLTV